MKTGTLFFLMVFFCVSSQVHAVIISVPDDFETIQAAIDSSSNGDTVLVEPETYVENINFNGKNIVLASLFMNSGEPEHIEQTILDGDSTNSVLTFMDGETADAVLIGFTVTNGSGFVSGGNTFGGGIVVFQASPTISNCIFTGNTAVIGGGVYCEVAPIVMTECLFTENSATYGGGLLCQNTPATITDCVFEGNSADFGGGVYFINVTNALQFSDCIISGNSSVTNGGGIFGNVMSTQILDCVISENTTEGNGGGLSFAGNSVVSIMNCEVLLNTAVEGGGGFHFGANTRPTIERCILDGNATDGNGGGVLCDADSRPTIVNCTFEANVAEIAGGAVSASNSQLILTSSILWEDEPQEISADGGNVVVTYSDVQGGEEGVDGDVDWGNGNIDENPEFVDVEAGDFRLTEDSPCIDAGDPRLPFDPDGTRRDQGVFYFHHEHIPRTYNVPEDFETIQEAIFATAFGDTIIVQPGEYGGESIDFYGRQIIVASMYFLTGEEAYIDSTVIEGDRNGSVILFARGETEDTRLIGFTIREGSADQGGGIFCQGTNPSISNCFITGNAASIGGGLYCRDASPSLSDCFFEDNAANFGAGVYLESSNATFEDCSIIDHSARLGAGIYCAGSSPRLTNCFIIGNNAVENGGGIFIFDDSNPVLDHCIISENQAAGGGGGIAVTNNCNPTFTNCVIDRNDAEQGAGVYCERRVFATFSYCTITNNFAETFGGGFSLWEEAYAVITNCTITGNSGQIGGGICSSLSSPSLINTVVWGNEGAPIYFEAIDFWKVIVVAHSDIEGGREGLVTEDARQVRWREGNIGADPLFADAEGGNYNLLENSPCIDAGVDRWIEGRDTLVNISQEAFAGDAPDIGAYESGMGEGVETPSPAPPTELALVANYPNPFNASTAIRFDIPAPVEISLKIFDLAGREVAVLVDGPIAAGRHSATWDASGFSSGIYFTRLITQTGQSNFNQERHKTIKLTLIK